MRTLKMALQCTLAVAALLIGAGCEDGNDDFDHNTLAGQGALIVDNNSPNDLILYVDGVRTVDVRDGHWEAVDLSPGVHRVVLDDEDSNESFGNDVDILDGRKTILSVDGNTYGGNSLQYYIYFD